MNVHVFEVLARLPFYHNAWHSLTVANKHSAPMEPGLEQFLFHKDLGDEFFWGSINQVTHNPTIWTRVIVVLFEHGLIHLWGPFRVPKLLFLGFCIILELIDQCPANLVTRDVDRTPLEYYGKNIRLSLTKKQFTACVINIIKYNTLPLDGLHL